MKRNRMFVAGMTALVLAFGMTVVGCGNGSTDNGSTGGDPKSITITGITGKTGTAWITLLSSANRMVAGGEGTIVNGSATLALFPLSGESEDPWSGSGSFYLMLEIGANTDSILDTYIYTNGKTAAQIGLTDISSDGTTATQLDIAHISSAADMLEKMPKYTISSAASTIGFSQFIASLWYNIVE